MWGIITQIMWGAFLLVGGIYDLQKKCISFSIIIAGLILTCLCCYSSGNWKSNIIGLLAGATFIGISKITKEALGYGDSIMCIFLGGSFGMGVLIESCTIGFVLCTVISIIGIYRKKMEIKSEIPFLPFLFCGYVVRCII